MDRPDREDRNSRIEYHRATEAATMIRTVLMVVVLLASAAIASAECATRWTVHAAFRSTEQCRAASSKQAVDYANSYRGTVSEDLRGPNVTVTGYDHLTVVTYLCLPDTVDPRGPKGK